MLKSYKLFCALAFRLHGGMTAAMRTAPLLALIALAPFAVGAEQKNDPRFDRAATRSREAGGISMLVLVDGKVVYEEYPNEGASTRATELASGTKSFSGVLALCAVEDQLLKLDEQVSDTITEWRDDPWRRKISLRQLLTLTSGIPGGPTAMATGRVQTYAEAIAAKAEAPPGTKFSYGPQPFQVFGEVLRRKLERKDDTVMAYLQRRILRPLDIKPGRWRKGEDGHPTIPSGAALTARDWAKFGEMVRKDGAGVLPPGRITECFRGTKVSPGYGLTWWLPGVGPIGGSIVRDVGSAWLPDDTWLAAGAGGQRLVVVPSLQLVAVRQAPIRRTARSAFNDRDWLRALLDPLTVKAGE